MTDTKKKITSLNLSVKVVEKLEAQAKSNDRSSSSEANFILKKALKVK